MSGPCPPLGCPEMQPLSAGGKASASQRPGLFACPRAARGASPNRDAIIITYPAMPPNFLSHAELDAVIRLAPLVAINLIIRNARSEVLLGLRTNEPAKDRYFVPGRMITKNERLAEASARIVKNETGRAAKFEDARLLGVFEHFYDNNRSGKAGYGTHYVVLGYQLEWRRSPTTNTASCAGGPSPNWHRTACTKIPSLFSGWSAVLKPR